MDKKPQVLVLGGGFGGLGAAQKLSKLDVEITLIDKHNYHTFQPMLYQVATDLIATEEVGHPLRDVFQEQANLRLHTDTVTEIDLSNRQVKFAKIDPIIYDYLVLALGAAFFPSLYPAGCSAPQAAYPGEMGGR
jgi:NADH dehydrogenase